MKVKFDVLTLFPELFEQHLNYLPFKRAIQNKLLEVNLHQIRDWAVDVRGTVDDRPYGGGVGMVLRPEPIYNCLQSIRREKRCKVVTLAPSGNVYDQKKASEYSKMEQVILINGRYEGIDQRILDFYSDEVISLGNFVLSGGEIASLAIMESVTRLLPGVLEKKEASTKESFSSTMEGKIEHPQYTRPEVFLGHHVPKILISGNHEEIQKWRTGENK